MRRTNLLNALALLVATSVGAAASGPPPHVIATVSAALAEGSAVFRTDHPDAVAIAVEVTDAASGRVLFASGVRRGREVVWPDAALDGPVRHVVRAWSVDGTLIATTTATTAAAVALAAVPFETVPADVALATAGRIALQADVEVGSESVAGNIFLLRPGASNPTLELHTDFVDGGLLLAYDETGGALNASLGASPFGSGGALVVTGSNGDSAAQLPGGAINAVEILNEPGAASDEATASAIAVGTTATVLAYRTLTAPAAGYILAVGSTAVTLEGNFVNLAVSLSGSSMPTSTNVRVYSAGPAALPATSVGLFPVAAGTTTVYLVAKSEGGGGVSAQEGSLVLLYVPTAYGIVGNAAGLVADSDDDARVAFDAALALGAERTAAAVQAAARQNRELGEVRERLDAIERALAAQRRGRAGD